MRGTFLAAAVTALVVGFAVAVGTEVLLGRESARQYPGGSLGAGLISGFAYQAGIVPVILGAIFGVIGWVLYRLVLPIR